MKQFNKLRNGIVILVMILLLIMSFTSCDQGTTSNSPNPSNQGTKETDDNGGTVINVLLQQDQYRPIYGDVSSWQDLIKDKFDLDIKVNYIMAGSNGGAISEIVSKIKNDYDGLIMLWSSNDMNIINLSEQGLILPLDEYIKDNDVFSSFPSYMYERFILTDNKLWGLPIMYWTVPQARLVRSDWLESVGMEMPETLNQLYDMFRAFTYDDPNKSGKLDTYGLAVRTNYGLMGLGDLFLANGCFLNTFGSSSISFDRHEGTYEDAFLKDDAIEVLNMINTMAGENIIHQVTYNNSNAYEAQNVDGSYYNYITSIGDKSKNSVLWYVKGTCNDFLCRSSEGFGCYVLSAATKDPSSVVNKFIDTFYGSAEGYYVAYGGIEGVDFRVEDKTYITVSGNKRIHLLDEYAPYLITSGYYYDDENMSDPFKSIEYLITSSNYLYSNNIMFNTSVLDGPYSKNFENESVKMINKIIANEITVEDALAEYRITMIQMGAQDFIDEMNSAIGKVTGNRY